MIGKGINKSECPHIGEIKITSTDKSKCDVCEITEHLRICTTCGAVHCCESGNGHNTEHFKATGHPIIVADNADYDFTWCYECEAYLK